MAFRFPTSGHYTFPSGTTGDVHEFLYTDPLNTDLTLPDATNTAREACWDTDATPSTDVGPVDGPGGDGYIYLEASDPGGAGDQMHVEKEDQASLGNPLTFDASANDIVVEFSTDQRGADNDATAQVYTNENAAGWVARGTLFGGSGDPDKVATGGTNIIVNRSVDLTGLISHASTRVRITTELQGTTVWHADYGISRIAIIGTDQISNEIDGITYDKDGSALGSCICTLYKDNGDDTISYWDRVTSHATTGAFTFADINSADASFFIVATKADTPDIVDVSERTIQPAVSYSGTVDLYLRSQVDKSETAGDGDLRLRSQSDKESTVYILTAAGGVYALTGTAAALERAAALDAAAGAYAVSGQDATLDLDRLIAAAGGAYALTGQAAALERAALLDAAGGAYALTGTVAGLERSALIDAAAGAYDLTGTAAELVYSIKLAAEGGAYALTGQDAGFLRDVILVAAGGAYALTGQAALLEYHRLLTAAGGAYDLTGQDASLVQSVALVAEGGAYALTGQDAGFLLDTVLDAAGGAYALSGQAALLEYHRLMSAVGGAYALSGQDAGLIFGFTTFLDAQPGAYALSGQDAGFLVQALLQAGGGAYAWSGQDAGFLRALRLHHEAGAYLLVGFDAGLVYSTGIRPIAKLSAQWSGASDLTAERTGIADVPADHGGTVKV